MSASSGSPPGAGMARLARALGLWLEGPPGDPGLPGRHADLEDLLAPLVAPIVAAEPAAAGTRRLGDFELVREIGRGGMGVVYEAIQVSLRRRVALKLLPNAGALPPEVVTRFLREAAVVAQLDHPHIVRVIAVGTDPELPYFVMESCDGGALRVEPRPVRASVEIALQLADALECAHRRGVVHRDVKPANVLVRADGSIALSDFGLARDAAMPGLTASGASAGTPAYMAPEQIEGRGADARTDVFALGATLYELLTLRRAFAGATSPEVTRRILTQDPPDPRRSARDLPADLVAIVQKALEKDPARRYPSAAELGADLRRFLAFEPVRARVASRLARSWRWLRRERLRTALAATLLVAVPAIAALGISLLAHAPEIRAGASKLLRDRVEELVAEAYLITPARPDAARTMFDAALALDPMDVEANTGCLLALGLLGTTADAARAWIDGRPAPVRGHPALWRAFGTTFVPDQAPAPPADPLSCALDARNARIVHHYDPAETHRAGLQLARRAVALAPAARLLYHGEWAQNAAMAKDPAECRAAAEALQRLWPDSAVAQTHAALALTHVDLPAARRAYERAVELRESSHVAHAGLAFVQREQGDLAGAVRHNRRALELEPGYFPAAHNLGLCLEDQGDRRGAAAAYAAATRASPRATLHHEALLRVLQQLGDESALAAERARFAAATDAK